MLRKLTLLSIAFFTLFSNTACNRKHDLCTELSENESQRIAVLLQRNGLNASKIRVASEDKATWSVIIETPYIIGDTAIVAAEAILDENDLPRDKYNPITNVFKGDSLIPTDTEEDLRKLSAIQESLELTLEKINGVVSSDVNVVLPNPNPLVEQSRQIQPSASVLLKYNTETPPLDVAEVRNIIAPAVEGLDPARVQVVMKSVPAPNAAKFDNLKNNIIRYLGLGATAAILVLMGLFMYSFLRMRKLAETVAQLERERSMALRKGQNQPVPATK